MASALWVVVGGGDRGGIVARAGLDLASPLLPERLTTGALVREVEREGDRLRFRRLTGEGPEEGWASTTLQGGKELLVKADQAWTVVGGEDKGGIVVRVGPEPNSALAPTRLSTGALVLEQRLAGERLHYRRLTGTGPDSGWVGLRLQSGKQLVARTDCALGGGAPDPSPAPSSSGSGRRLRILALHGKCSNANIMKVQCAGLKKELGKEAEWVFLDGNIPYDPEKESTPHYDPTEYEVTISRGQPFLQWYNHRLSDARYEFVDDGLRHIRRCLEEQGPFDAIVSFSMASNVISMLLQRLREEGVTAPWQLSVFFNGGIPRDSAYEIADPLSQPTVKVHGGKTDPFWKGGEPSMSFMYSDLLEMGHEDGHAFPRTQPRAGEILARVAAALRRRCVLGLQGWDP